MRPEPGNGRGPALVALTALVAACGGAAGSAAGPEAPAPAVVGMPVDRTNVGSARPEAGAASSPAPSAGGFGLSRERAVQVCMPDGERDYLASLRCPDGRPPLFARRGNVGPRNPGSEGADMRMMDPHFVLPPGTVDGHIVDLYDVRCSDGTAVEVYMDMYHCAQPDPLQPIGPLSPAIDGLAPGSI